MAADHLPFRNRLHVQRFSDAKYFAAPLFEEIFRHDFPVPPHNSGWAQYVAFYRWDDNRIEPVGFCNFVPLEDIWLEGGLCVNRSFYARLAEPQAAQCKGMGGVAQVIMEVAATELAACAAWFAYVGDAQSLKVCTRMGYERTEEQYLIVKWFRSLAQEKKKELIADVAALGPF